MGEYPLQRRFLVWGLWAALIGVLFMDLLAGFSLLVLFLAMGALWRRDEPPILAISIGYQWVFVVTGHLYQQVTGFYPSRDVVAENMGNATFLSLIGLLLLAAGIRAGFYSLRGHLLFAQRQQETLTPRYDARRLLWYVIALYTINWFVEILPAAIFFNAAEFIQNTLEFRSVFLCLLFLVILRQRQGYLYGAVALTYVAIPQLGGMHLTAFEVLFFLLVILLGEWHPWSKAIADRRRNLRIALASAGIVLALFYTVGFWQESLKSAWRPRLLSGEQAGTPMERVRAFLSAVAEVQSGGGWGGSGESPVGESLAERLSGTINFSYVLERVPEVVPHEGGALMLRALAHSFMPRFLFPEKPVLSSNSWLVRQYAGRAVAGDAEGTSIGLSYMAELYIDFGVVGMFMALFLWGLVVGLVYGGLLLFSPSHYFSSAAVIAMFPQVIASYEGEIAFMLGGLMNRLVVYGVLLYAVGPWLHRSLQHRNRRSEIRFQRVVPFRASS